MNGQDMVNVRFGLPPHNFEGKDNSENLIYDECSITLSYRVETTPRRTI